MQSQVTVSVDVVASEVAGGDLSLTITSTPPCALPIAQNCSRRTFDVSSQNSTSGFLVVQEIIRMSQVLTHWPTLNADVRGIDDIEILV